MCDCFCEGILFNRLLMCVYLGIKKLKYFKVLVGMCVMREEIIVKEKNE